MQLPNISFYMRYIIKFKYAQHGVGFSSIMRVNLTIPAISINLNWNIKPFTVDMVPLYERIDYHSYFFILKRSL